MTTLTQKQPSAQQSEVNEEILRLAKHIPSDSTIFIMRCTFLFIICIVATLLLSWDVHAADPFAPAKSEIVDTVGTGSTAQFAILAVGLCAAAVGGFLTKNWGGAIGGFIVGVIFVNVGMKVVGL
ncbi:hypothetical protein G3495_21010 [Shewanella baltica]|uniref:hypothetical protein n=1 Tax=Shewanella baltica TaxID=62322 RepID=UPI00217E3469|nr:hypothetical protein [Shewanella baltica]MCS6125049.1 hypothetical protein [Shewanella baltica]MCS6237567.1 hypothetical protein [Shewanella baltica]MCS6261641.1 hypothetical protein [Shewanella baltica]MCS6272144.1 hypothetical protein [Shewanella baltica]